MPPLSVLIKPVSGCCNMACRYCFYTDLIQNRPAPGEQRMEGELLETVVRRALELAGQKPAGACTFGFQGGEPTLAGLEFYRRLPELVRRHNHAGVPVLYTLQTNGLLLDAEWAAFLAGQRFLVGLSADGTAKLHDYFRTDRKGGGTFAAVQRAARLLDRYGVPYNILTVVTAQAARHIQSIYAFYRRSGWRCQQYIPCLDPLGEPRGSRAYSLTPALYGQFLCTLFDLWYRDIRAGEPVSIRYFDTLLALLRGQPAGSCGANGVCSCQLVVEADGSVYPCDFYVLDDYRLGSVREQDFASLRQSGKAQEFIRSSAVLPGECRACRWLPLCRNGCRRDRDPVTGSRFGVNYYCEAYRTFFAHAYPRLCQLA